MQGTKIEQATTKPIDEGFRERAHQACELNPNVPGYNHGRLAFIQRELELDYGIKISRETVRKWLEGETRPRVAKMKALASLLNVDEGWLALGIDNMNSSAGSRQLPRNVDSAILNVAGILGLSGAHIAFPEEDNADKVHFFAIHESRQREFHVSLAEPEGSGHVVFALPKSYRNKCCVGVLPTEGLNFSYYSISSELIDKFGEAEGDQINLKLKIGGGVLSYRSAKLIPASKLSDFI